jgi:hypothetical protein
MRILNTKTTGGALIAAAVAGALALGGASSASAGVTGCSAPGGKQEAGAVIGALLGGVIGNKVGGRHATGETGPFDGVPGTNLVQASVGGTVVAAASIELRPGRSVLVWLAPGEPAPRGEVLAHDVDDIGEGAPDEAAAERLAGAGWLLSDRGADVVYAGRVDGQVALWRAEEGTLERVGGRSAPRTSTPVPVELPPWRWSFGFDVGGGWAGAQDEPLQDLGGGRLLSGVHARIGLAERWNVAIAAQPDLLWRALSQAEGEGTLYHATLPFRAGVRWGWRGDAWSPEVGLDLGVHYFGNFEGTDRASPTLALAGGIARGLGRQTGLRAEAFFGAGLGYLTTGLAVGVEARR